MAAVGRVDSCKLHPFLVVPGVGAGHRNGNKDPSAKCSPLQNVLHRCDENCLLKQGQLSVLFLKVYQIFLHGYLCKATSKMHALWDLLETGIRHYETFLFFLPDKSIPLSVQASQTYLFPTHSFPLFFTGGIRGIHGAVWSLEKIINH